MDPAIGSFVAATVSLVVAGLSFWKATAVARLQAEQAKQLEDYKHHLKLLGTTHSKRTELIDQLWELLTGVHEKIDATAFGKWEVKEWKTMLHDIDQAHKLASPYLPPAIDQAFGDAISTAHSLGVNRRQAGDTGRSSMTLERKRLMAERWETVGKRQDEFHKLRDKLREMIAAFHRGEDIGSDKEPDDEG